MRNIKIEQDSFPMAMLVLILAIVLFNGDPDIADALREVALKWSGMK